MEIKHVLIENWEAPGAAYWEKAAAEPDEPHIVATITMQLSHNEYQTLLEENRRRYQEAYAKAATTTAPGLAREAQ